MPTKVCLVKAMACPVVIYGLESWTIKKAGHRRIDAFELWCWRRLFRVPWTARRSNQSILKEISSEYSLEGLMLKLKLQYLATWCKELSHWKRPWCWERLKVGGEGDDRGWDSWMESLTQWTWVWASSRSWWWTGRPGVLQSMGSKRVRHELSWIELSSQGFPDGSAGKELTCKAAVTGDLSLIPGSRRYPGGGHGNPLQHSCLKNPMDRGAWQGTVHGVAKSWTQLKRLKTHACTFKSMELRLIEGWLCVYGTN